MPKPTTYLWLTFVALVLPLRANGQRGAMGEMLTRFEASGLNLLLPLEQRYRQRGQSAGDLLPDHLRLWSGREGLDIRLFLEPETSARQGHLLSPPFRSMRLVAHLATNHPDAHISVHSLGSQALEQYGAHWGRQYTFQPKAKLSRRTFGQLIALHHEDLGTAYVLLLFDRPSKEVETRRYALQFSRQKAPVAE